MNEVVLKINQPVFEIQVGLKNYYATRDASEDPNPPGETIWRLIPPANTVDELVEQDEDFTIIGDLYVWERISEEE